MDERSPGWYVDERGDLRWWDGQGWTGHVHTPSDVPEAGPGTPDAAASLPGSASGPAYGSASAGVAVAERTAPAASPVRPQRPRWILWTVLVVVGLLVGVVVAVVVTLVSDAVRASEQERAAVAAVEGYDAAWGDADCARFEASTTAELRESLGYADCAVFVQDAEIFGETVQNYEQSVTTVTRRDDGTVAVRTEESYLNLVGAEGEALAEPEPFLLEYEYVVVPVGEQWLINDFYYPEDAQTP